jgi:ornithine--oxo-acid transaminase
MLRQLTRTVPIPSVTLWRSASTIVDEAKVKIGAKFSSEEIMDMEKTYSAQNYSPLPIVFQKAEGVHVWDPEGRKYYDFLSAYSAVNQGHCHPKILDALYYQAKNVTLSSRAFYNSVFGQWAKYVTNLFGYDKVLPMNTGAEGVETAVKLARKWGYAKKNIPKNEAIIISCRESFHGRTVTAISLTDQEDSRDQFGPFLPGIKHVTYGDVKDLEKVLDEYGKNVAGFIVEPIQGEAGVKVPPPGYLRAAYELCKKHNVLFIADEIQTGIARTGKMMCYEWELGTAKPDVLILGKALSGGVFPVSCVLSSAEIMGVIKPGTHGSTFGGNPLGCAVSMAALEVVKDENLVEKAEKLGKIFREESASLVGPERIVTQVRGRGLLNAYVTNPKHPGLAKNKQSAYDICKKLKTNGLLAKQTHDDIIRFAPPLVIKEDQIRECLQIIKRTIQEFEKQ